MMEIFNELLEYIIVLNDSKRIIFINNEFKKQIGYEECELSEEQLNNIININENEIIILCKDKMLIEASVLFKEINLNNNMYYISIVKWEEDRVNTLINIERCIDSIDQFISIKNKNSKYIFVNNRFANEFKSTRKEAKERMNIEIESGKYKDIMLNGDNYVRCAKSSSHNEQIINNDGIKECYDIKKYPVFHCDGNVEYIATVIEEVTLKKGVQTQALYAINILEKIEGTDIDEYGPIIFDCLEPVFKRYFQCESFNIWAYNKENKSLKAYFNNSTVINAKEIALEDDKIEKYINNDYKRILYTGKVDDNKGGSLYIVRYPIIYCNEFLGLLTINYEEFPNQKVIENELINTVSIQLGHIMKYVQISNKHN